MYALMKDRKTYMADAATRHGRGLLVVIGLALIFFVLLGLIVLKSRSEPEEEAARPNETLTVLPVRFLYPNLTPKPWRTPVIVGALVWLGMMLWLLVDYPQAPVWMVWLSLVYPAFYFWLSYRLARREALLGTATATRTP